MRSLISTLQAFSTVLNNALAGAYGNITADDVRAMTYIAYMNSNPNFQAFNQALFAAVNLNDTSGFDYSTIAAEYAAGFFIVLPTLCLDERVYTSISFQLGINFYLLDDLEQISTTTPSVDSRL